MKWHLRQYRVTIWEMDTTYRFDIEHKRNHAPTWEPVSLNRQESRLEDVTEAVDSVIRAHQNSR